MIDRVLHMRQIQALLKRYPVVGLLGARQVGKTTLARALTPGSSPHNRFDLEDPIDVARLTDPIDGLRRRRGLIVLDEIQRRPELFPVLRVLADERPLRRRFLVLGSASPHLLKQGSESLAGRIAYHEIGPFNVSEIEPRHWARLWLRGGFPDSFTARSDAASFDWRRRFRSTFIERDLPLLELPYTPAPSALGRFWSMLAHVHGELLNWSELGRSMGVSDLTARRYADLLEGTMMVRLLKPWYENIGKRQVKSPKLYFRDSGLLHLQLGIPDEEALLRHPKLGASWEGFIIEQLITLSGAAADEAFFWQTEHGAELDLLLMLRGKRIGVEVKRTSAPTFTPSMRSALADLKLDALYVVHGGDHRFALAPRVEAVPFSMLLSLATSLQRGTRLSR